MLFQPHFLNWKIPFVHSHSEAMDWLHTIYSYYVTQNSNTRGKKSQNPATITRRNWIKQHYASPASHWSPRFSAEAGHPIQALATLLSVLGSSRWYLHRLQGPSLNVYVLIHSFMHAMESLDWLVSWVLLGVYRCFSCEWVWWRMPRNKRKCGKGNTKLRPTRYMLCAQTLAVSSSRCCVWWIVLSV